ncbi:GntR family transcriptional regulator [Telmatospirillum siberiense]|uniref:GntR family transcriptional regulator n=1 Tax=Telmatospirillum siberiense TaxID=382514 RepID=A0A2N3PSR3_9PROT|nr:GntR family transcriptional regulator [Telmatospirillum siberiense]PKU23439.1 GntR family transcriptional regulator [Telmatospirillum siberiense]
MIPKDHSVLSLPETVYRGLRTAILNGVYPPGQMLRQEDIARRLGVSRVPLREALARLEAEGLVVLHPRRGYAVLSLDPREIGEVFALRARIEEHMAAVATAERSDEDIAQARVLRRQMANAATAGLAAAESWFELHIRFHDVLLGLPDRPVIHRIVNGLQRMVEPYIRVESRLTGDLDQAEAEHDRLLEGFIAGDAAGVAALTREHVDHTAARLLDGLEQWRS